MQLQLVTDVELRMRASMTFLPLLRFHVASAARVALRSAVPQIALLVAWVGMQPSPGFFLGQLAHGAATGDVWPAVPVFFGIWSLILAAATSRRLVPATQGWHRHLAVTSRQHRLTMLCTCILGQLPLAVFWLALWLGALGQGWEARFVYLCSLVLLLPASASLTLPGRGLRTLPLGWVAWLAAVTVDPWGCLVGCFCLALREGLETSWRAPRRRSRLLSTGLPLGWTPRVLGRALGRRWLAPYPAAVLLLAAGWLFLRNNELDVQQASVGIRLCGCLAVAVVLLQLADQVRLRRPPWSWIRSQPWTARRRVLEDASWLAVSCLPVVLASFWVGAGEAPLASWVLLPVAAYLAMRVSGSLWRRKPGASRLGAAIYVETALVVAWCAVTAWAAVVLCVLLPLAWTWAATAEQRFKVSRFHERHHHLQGETST